MASRAEQEEYLASIAQAVDVGDFDYLPPDQIRVLNDLIAAAWNALKQGEDVAPHIDKIEQVRERR
ncbi:hypothetical protein [Thermocoleostomius sinensis]|uniref:Uncharacterized protein n=1 Tax=Thermocoleostomius sinensis A174 TaxID=2016057 RepID=A0A9E8ZI12_9CYAN|nr:hypothetical protein [Thermocoleostomius sinensis]WAL58886.1 hypothetical protein OXH18_17125 [Thermocoleostomius sinensis A174]